jgi:hypothetical protein
MKMKMKRPSSLEKIDQDINLDMNSTAWNPLTPLRTNSIWHDIFAELCHLCESGPYKRAAQAGDAVYDTPEPQNVQESPARNSNIARMILPITACQLGQTDRTEAFGAAPQR